MKHRCGDLNDKNYGGKGISVSDGWKDYKNFYDWSIANGYEDKLTIDRKDNNGNYYAENCRWVTMKNQQRNRSDNHLLTYNGDTKPMSEWAEACGMNYYTLVRRIKSLWSIPDALTRPVRGY
jgi:hypothetical protein